MRREDVVRLYQCLRELAEVGDGEYEGGCSVDWLKDVVQGVAIKGELPGKMRQVLDKAVRHAYGVKAYAYRALEELQVVYEEVVQGDGR